MKRWIVCAIGLLFMAGCGFAGAGAPGDASHVVLEYEIFAESGEGEMDEETKQELARERMLRRLEAILGEFDAIEDVKVTLSQAAGGGQAAVSVLTNTGGELSPENAQAVADIVAATLDELAGEEIQITYREAEQAE